MVQRTIMNQLIKEVTILNESSKEVQEKLKVLSLKLEEMSSSFMNFGKELVPIVPPAARCEKAIANFIKSLPEKQNKLLLVGKGIERSTELKDEYLKCYSSWHEATVKLNRMIAQKNPALKNRIKLQEERVSKFKKELDGSEAEAKLELELIKSEQEALIKNNIVILLEIQKKVFDQCSGALDTFRLEWNTGKRFI